MHIDTAAVLTGGFQVGQARPASTPIYQTATFGFEDPAACAEALRNPDRGFAYSRHANPTTRALENAVAELEGAEAGLAAGSGMGAITAVLMSLLESGDHIVAQRRLYGGTYRVLTELSRKYGISVSLVSGSDPAELVRALRPESKVLYLETMANPTTSVSDLPGLMGAARHAGVTCVVDNTFATPVLCRPIEHGADVVVHSATKYLGGHSDVSAGVGVFRRQSDYRRVWEFATELGVTPDPFAAWLVLRGLKTLPLRMRQHCAGARQLAGLLSKDGRVSKVYWPGHADHDDYLIAQTILDDFGGVVCFEVPGGRPAAVEVLRRLRLVKLAPSLGGPETLVLHPASTSHRELDRAELARAGIDEGLVRVSVGLEHPDDLWGDFAQALRGVAG